MYKVYIEGKGGFFQDLKGKTTVIRGSVSDEDIRKRNEEFEGRFQSRPVKCPLRRVNHQWVDVTGKGQ